MRGSLACLTSHSLCEIEFQADGAAAVDTTVVTCVEAHQVRIDSAYLQSHRCAVARRNPSPHPYGFVLCWLARIGPR